MDSLTQAAAYLRPSLEVFAKVGSIIPLWMIMVMTDKYLLGIPLLEGSIWRSPRIPPRISMGKKHGDVKSSPFKTDRDSATDSPNSSRGGEDGHFFEAVRPSTPSSSGLFEPDFSDTTTQIRRLNQGSPFISNSLSLRASSTTALSVYTPLEMHDPLFAWTPWYESDYYCAVIMLLAAMLFLGIINIGRSLWTSQGTEESTKRNTKDVGMQFRDTLAQQHLTLEIPAYWEFIPSAVVPLDSETISQDDSREPKTAAPCGQGEELLTKLKEENSFKDKKYYDT